MFVALEMKEAPGKGIFGGLLNILTLPKVELELRQVRNVRFIVASTYETKRGMNWEELETACARYLDRFLLPVDVSPPQDSAMQPPALVRFERQVLLHTACEIIARSKMPMYRRILGFIDPTGEHANQLETLLHHYTSVRVVTDNLERYEQEREHLMEQLGAPILISDQPTILQDCVLIVSPKSFHGDWKEKMPCPVMAGGALLTSTPCDCISGLRVSPPPDVRKACPTGVDPHLFLGALYECCGAKDLPTIADKMLYNQKVSGLDEVVRLVLHQAGYRGSLA